MRFAHWEPCWQPSHRALSWQNFIRYAARHGKSVLQQGRALRAFGMLLRHRALLDIVRS